MHLTPEQANNKKLIRYLAEQAIPEAIHSIYPLPAGITSHNFEINHHIIFKLPGLTTPVSSWIQQSQCAPILQKYLSCRIPQPALSPVFLNSTAHDFLLSSSHEKIEGKTISHSSDFFKKDISFKTHFFEQLSNFTHQIHSIPSEALPVRIPTAEEFLKNLFLRSVGGITPFQEKNLHKIIHSSVFGFNEKLSSSTLCHCDLRPANICLDKRDNIVGILDFDSLNRGEPFFEFRPMLYGSENHEADTKLFYHIYCHKTGYKTHPNNLKKMRRLFWSLCIFSAICKVDKAQGIKEKICFFKGMKNIFKSL